MPLNQSGRVRVISSEELRQRRTHVRIAIAENRLERIETSAEARAALDAYIRGAIDADDLVRAYNEGRYKPL